MAKTLRTWNNGNVAVVLTESETGYFYVHSSVFDGVKWQISSARKAYKTEKNALKAAHASIDKISAGWTANPTWTEKSYDPESERQYSPTTRPATTPSGESELGVVERSYNPIDYGFTWTSDWYSWDGDLAMRSAVSDRYDDARELKARGYDVKLSTSPRQLITRGGIGSGHPEISLEVTVYLLRATRPLRQSNSLAGKAEAVAERLMARGFFVKGGGAEMWLISGFLSSEAVADLPSAPYNDQIKRLTDSELIEFGESFLS